MKFEIQEQIFERFEGLSIAVVSVRDCDNSRMSEEIASLLSDTCKQVQAEWTESKIDEDARIAAWREAYRSFGAKPKKYRCSIENLLRMIVGGREMPPISPLVDLYNVISLKHLLPVGGDDLDNVSGYISLTIASGEESFIPLNSQEPMAPKAGEVVYRDDQEVLCRRWNWRECDKSKLTENSKNVALVVEGLPPTSKDDVTGAANELAELVLQHCGGSVDVHLLDSQKPSVEF